MIKRIETELTSKPVGIAGRMMTTGSIEEMVAGPSTARPSSLTTLNLGRECFNEIGPCIWFLWKNFYQLHINVEHGKFCRKKGPCVQSPQTAAEGIRKKVQIHYVGMVCVDILRPIK